MSDYENIGSVDKMENDACHGSESSSVWNSLVDEVTQPKLSVEEAAKLFVGGATVSEISTDNHDYIEPNLTHNAHNEELQQSSSVWSLG